MEAHDDWRDPGWPMKQQSGVLRVFPKADRSAVLLKRYAAIITAERHAGDPRFKRYSWTWNERPFHVVIQFIGDHSLGELLIHITYIRQLPILSKLTLALKS